MTIDKLSWLSKITHTYTLNLVCLATISSHVHCAQCTSSSDWVVKSCRPHIGQSMAGLAMFFTSGLEVSCHCIAIAPTPLWGVACTISSSATFRTPYPGGIPAAEWESVLKEKEKGEKKDKHRRQIASSPVLHILRGTKAWQRQC